MPGKEQDETPIPLSTILWTLIFILAVGGVLIVANYDLILDPVWICVAVFDPLIIAGIVLKIFSLEPQPENLPKSETTIETSSPAVEKEATNKTLEKMTSTAPTKKPIERSHAIEKKVELKPESKSEPKPEIKINKAIPTKEPEPVKKKKEEQALSPKIEKPGDREIPAAEAVIKTIAPEVTSLENRKPAEATKMPQKFDFIIKRNRVGDGTKEQFQKGLVDLVWQKPGQKSIDKLAELWNSSETMDASERIKSFASNPHCFLFFNACILSQKARLDYTSLLFDALHSYIKSKDPRFAYKADVFQEYLLPRLQKGIKIANLPLELSSIYEAALFTGDNPNASEGLWALSSDLGDMVSRYLRGSQPVQKENENLAVLSSRSLSFKPDAELSALATPPTDALQVVFEPEPVAQTSFILSREKTLSVSEKIVDSSACPFCSTSLQLEDSHKESVIICGECRAPLKVENDLSLRPATKKGKKICPSCSADMLLPIELLKEKGRIRCPYCQAEFQV